MPAIFLQQPCLSILSVFQVHDSCHYFTLMSFCTVTTEKNPIKCLSKYTKSLFILKANYYISHHHHKINRLGLDVLILCSFLIAGLLNLVIITV